MENNEGQRGNPVPPVHDPMVDPVQGNEAPMIYTVRDAMRECGVNDYDNFDGRTPAQRQTLLRTRGRSGSHQESRKISKHLSNGHAMNTGLDATHNMAFLTAMKHKSSCGDITRTSSSWRNHLIWQMQQDLQSLHPP